jgi:hypothetical protein
VKYISVISVILMDQTSTNGTCYIWSKTLNFPHVSDQAICAKLAKLLKDYERCRKKQNFDALNELFDVTNVKGEWMCKEDENLYKLQIESKGQVGYSTGKPASAKTIHPSKRKKAIEATVSDCPHLPAQRHLIVPKVARTHPTTAKTVIGMMRMQHQRAQGNITQQALQDALLQVQSCRPTEQQRCAASFLVRALKSQPHVSQQSSRLCTQELLR